MNDSLVLRYNATAYLFKDGMDIASATWMIMFSLGHKPLDLPGMGYIHSSQCDDYFGRNKRLSSATVQFTLEGINMVFLGVSKKTKKPIKPRKPEKNNKKN